MGSLSIGPAPIVEAVFFPQREGLSIQHREENVGTRVDGSASARGACALQHAAVDADLGAVLEAERLSAPVRTNSMCVWWCIRFRETKRIREQVGLLLIIAGGEY